MDEKIKNGSLVAIAASAVVASSVYIYSNVVKDNTVPVAAKNSAVSTVVVTPTLAKLYKDGSYKGAGDYVTNSGALKHKMEVSLTIKGDVITAASTDLKDAVVSDYSKSSQTKFNTELLTAVVGKKVSDVDAVGKIAGSSDTTKGFKLGVENIKAQAAY